MAAYLFVGGVAAGQRIETDGSPEWLVPHPRKQRTRTLPAVPGPDVLIRLAIHQDRQAQSFDRYEHHEWREFGKLAEYRYIFVGRL